MWMVQKSQFPGSWDPNRPWAAVIACSASAAGGNMPWWFAHVDKPYLQSLSARGCAAMLEILEGGPAGPIRRSKREAHLARRDTAYGTGKRPDGRFIVLLVELE